MGRPRQLTDFERQNYPLVHRNDYVVEKCAECGKTRQLREFLGTGICTVCLLAQVDTIPENMRDMLTADETRDIPCSRCQNPITGKIGLAFGPVLFEDLVKQFQLCMHCWTDFLGWVDHASQQ